MKKAAIFLADGFEEMEAIAPIDILRRAGIEVDTVSINSDLKVIGAHGLKVETDINIKDVNVDLYDAVICPGGLPGSTNLRDNDKVISIIKEANSNGKLIAAICAAPIVLDAAGVLDVNYTTYPTVEKGIKSGTYQTDKKVVLDKNIITSAGPSTATDFAIEIVRYLLDDNSAKTIKDELLISKFS